VGYCRRNDETYYRTNVVVSSSIYSGEVVGYNPLITLTQAEAAALRSQLKNITVRR